MLEANHDTRMLQTGPYPYDLKKRIKSRKGHLSNDDAGTVAVELARSGARQIILGHLSKENNFPHLALRSCELYFRQAGLEPDVDVKLSVANRDGNSGMFSITAKLQ